jgi:hypothetical protein
MKPATEFTSRRIELHTFLNQTAAGSNDPAAVLYIKERQFGIESPFAFE